MLVTPPRHLRPAKLAPGTAHTAHGHTQLAGSRTWAGESAPAHNSSPRSRCSDPRTQSRSSAWHAYAIVSGWCDAGSGCRAADRHGSNCVQELMCPFSVSVLRHTAHLSSSASSVCVSSCRSLVCIPRHFATYSGKPGRFATNVKTKNIYKCKTEK